MKSTPVIGSKFVGPASSRNVQTGEFWSVSAELGKFEERLQKRLLGNATHWAIAHSGVMGLIFASVAMTGCANMTPEQSAALATAGAGIGAAALIYHIERRTPVYTPQPVYIAPVYVNPYPPCWGCRR